MDILGVRVDNVTFQEALEKAKNLIDAGGKHYIVTPNPEIIVRAQKDKEFRRILNQSSLSIPDGVGVVWAAKILGQPLSERVAGVDFLEGLAALAEEHGFKMFLLGAEGEVAKKASEELKKKYPRLEIIGTYAGNADPRFDKETRRKVGNRKIEIL